MYILGIETSCDETSAAVVKNGDTVCSNVISSQVDIHTRYGGVVPEVASRKHVEGVTYIVEQALKKARISLEELSAIAVTYGPGLVGSLLIGVAAAKALSFAKGIPLIQVHHIAGHIYANQLVSPLKFPLLALVVSGGHTELVYMEDDGKFQILGQTRDDAVGEAYDKVARAIKLPYPGGPHIDRLAQEGEPSLALPRAWLEPDSYDFSFSGLKSAVINTLHNANQRGEDVPREVMAASFQQAVVEVLVEKTARAVRQYQVKQVVLAGGVAANKGLRQALTDRMKKEKVEFLVPPLSLCTDNAAMIAAAAFTKYKKGKFASLDLNARPVISLEEESV
ncbi:tRNA (adenosine(37)-N6)-threonylcarbamoyltransferase complex transferase subunit TsaD [Microaerobacter geothermalis]|nr:tRNA (adenosine(37)-N6)-threonylcarbamoyltransferase complex transferase subunit TsaD [Microaerobacter geothermalis]MCF6093737.1 tRNA (adenosine(37)-N6)-threonylcarbamoyltransferase complex transferase subunit TsaD [Microaerobacter geothermalis]